MALGHPRSTIFVIDLSEFEWLIGCIQLERTSMTNILSKIKKYYQQKEKSGALNKPLFFHQALLAIVGDFSIPNILNETQQAYFHRLIKTL